MHGTSEKDVALSELPRVSELSGVWVYRSLSRFPQVFYFEVDFGGFDSTYSFLGGRQSRGIQRLF